MISSKPVSISLIALPILAGIAMASPQDNPVPRSDVMDSGSGIEYLPQARDYLDSRSLPGKTKSTIGTMRDNVNKPSHRGGRLDSLTDKTNDLAKAAESFKKKAGRRKRSLPGKTKSTIGTMRNNVNKPSHRGGRLDSLTDKTNDLAKAAESFKKKSGHRKRSLPGKTKSTIGTMRNNINKASHRGERLDSLTDKTNDLAKAAQSFKKKGRK